MRWALVLAAASAACGFAPTATSGDVPADAIDARGDASGGGSGSDSGGGSGTRQQVAAAQDTWLRQQFPDDVEIVDHLDGESLALRVGSGSSAGRANRAILQFDLGGLPQGCQLSAAKLYLYFFADDFSGISPTFSAHRVTRSWSDSTATWNTPWTNGGGDFDAGIESSVVIASGMYGWIAWDITTLATAWQAATSPNYGVEILEANDNTGNLGRKEFESSRAAQDNPYLDVTCN